MQQQVLTAFWTLLRAGLWEKDIDELRCFPLSESAWNEIFLIARQQTVTGLLYRGLFHLPEYFLPSVTVMARWMVEIDRIEKKNLEMNRKLAVLAGSLEKQGLYPILQKGQGIASLYAYPLLRECGDVDFYFPQREAWEKANDWMRQKGCTLQIRPDGSAFYLWKGLKVEHHLQGIDLQSPYLKKYLSGLEETKGYDWWTIEDESKSKVRVFVPELNLLMLNAHILKHVLGLGIGLRQLCDMARAYNLWHDRISGEEMKAIYYQCGLNNWSALLHAFLVQQLGLPEEKIPAPLPMGSSSEVLLKKVMSGGNFGFYSAERQKAIRNHRLGKWQTMTAFYRNARFAWHYAPAEAFWTLVNLVVGQCR